MRMCWKPFLFIYYNFLRKLHFLESGNINTLHFIRPCLFDEISEQITANKFVLHNTLDTQLFDAEGHLFEMMFFTPFVARLKCNALIDLLRSLFKISPGVTILVRTRVFFVTKVFKMRSLDLFCECFQISLIIKWLDIQDDLGSLRRSSLLTTFLLFACCLDGCQSGRIVLRVRVVVRVVAKQATSIRIRVGVASHHRSSWPVLLPRARRSQT